MPEREETWYAVGFDKFTGYMQAVSNGDRDFALRTAAYYRSIGYHGRVLTEEEFDRTQVSETADRRKQTAICWRRNHDGKDHLLQKS